MKIANCMKKDSQDFSDLVQRIDALLVGISIQNVVAILNTLLVQCALTIAPKIETPGGNPISPQDFVDLNARWLKDQIIMELD